MLDDACHTEIWSGLQRGDRESLMALYRTFYLSLFNYGIKLTSNKELTNDCITQVVLRLWDKRGSIPEVKNVRSYLLSCLRNEIYTELNAEAVRSDRERALQRFFGEAEPSFEQLLIDRQTEKAVKASLAKALEGLTSRERELLRLKFYEDLDYEEIAALCHITKRTAYNIVHSGLQNLRAALASKAGYYRVPDSSLLPLLLVLASGLC